MMAGTCRYCTCTDADGCEGGCNWADPDRTICSTCFAAVEIVELVLEVFAAIGPRARPPIPLPVVAWDGLNGEQQQLLVMAFRRLVEAHRDTLRDELQEDAIAVATEFGIIGNFLEQHFPDEVTDEAEPLSAILIRILTPHVGARILTP